MCKFDTFLKRGVGCARNATHDTVQENVQLESKSTVVGGNPVWQLSDPSKKTVLKWVDQSAYMSLCWLTCRNLA